MQREVDAVLFQISTCKKLYFMNKKTNRLHSSQKNAMLRARNREQIRSYFEQVLNLRNSGEAYPVKLDDVWPLVYGYKKKAIEVLKAEFYEGIDYITQSSDNQRSPQKGTNIGGDIKSKNYLLTTNCLEWFIARRERSVFEVYHQVFHLTIEASTPVAGVYPILYQGKVLYPYTLLLKAIGYSTRSGSVQSRRRQYPQHFMKYTDRNWITPAMAKLLVQQRDTRALQEQLKDAQQFLPFKEEE